MADEVYEVDLQFDSDADEAIDDLDEIDEGLEEVADGGQRSESAFLGLATGARSTVLPFLSAGFFAGILADNLFSIVGSSASVVNANNVLRDSLATTQTKHTCLLYTSPSPRDS